MSIKLNRKGAGLAGEDRVKENQNLEMIEQEFAGLESVKTDSAAAKLSALEALAKADAAETLSTQVQTQLNTVVVEGDSSPQALQASVGADGTEYGGSLKARLDAEQNETMAQLAETGTDLEQRAVNVFNFGVIGDGIADDTIALQNAANYAKAKKLPLFVSDKLVLKITDTVDLTSLRELVILGDIHSYVNNKPCLFVGGTSATTWSNRIYINWVEKKGGLNPGDIAVRVAGLKNGFVQINRAYYVQLWADSNQPQFASISYSKFIFGTVEQLELYGVTLNSWITECQFYGGRFQNEVRIGNVGSYAHNNNVFYKPCIEGAKLTVISGGRNTFYDTRTEGSAQITFGENSRFNVVYDGFISNPTSIYSGATVIDNGMENIVQTLMENTYIKKTLVYANYNTDISKLNLVDPINSLTKNSTNKTLAISNFGSLFNQVIDTRDLRRLHLISKSTDNTQQFRMFFKVYDENMAELTPTGSQKFVEMNGLTYDAATNRYVTSANTGQNNPIIVNKPVRYFRFELLGGSGGFSTLEWFALIGEFERKNIHSFDKVKELFYKRASSGTSTRRPIDPQAGQMFYDTALKKPIWYDGNAWKDAAGNSI